MESDSENLRKQIFSIMNWFDFSFCQKFFYKKTKLTSSYIFLFAKCLQFILQKYDGNIKIVQEYIQSRIKTVLGKAEFSQFTTKKCVKMLKSHILFGNKTDYRYLIIAEILFSAAQLGFSVDAAGKQKLQADLQFSDKQFSKALSYAQNPFSITDGRILKSFSPFLDFVKNSAEYNSLRVVNIGVCATMSAGKSSFVNALLGYDYLPMRNEATTARITSVYDNDRAKNLIGFTLKDGNPLDLDCALDSKKIDEWNASDEVERIFLQGDLDNIGNKGLIVAVHDTPGTNNSGDERHHKVTMDFLQKNKMDAIVFVANAEHLCTTDELELRQVLRSAQKLAVL